MGLSLKLSMALVEPVYEVNIGHMARLACNFGVEDFILINPKASLTKARKYAAHGAHILDGAKILSFDQLKNLDLLVGTTAITGRRVANITRITITPRDLKRRLMGFNKSVCLVFGRDTTGLTNEELEACDVVVNIPTGTPYPTLNVSHAAAILLYELKGVERHKTVRIATREERERLIHYTLELARLSKVPDHRVPLIEKALKRVVNGAGITSREVTLLMGLMRKAVLTVKGCVMA